MMKSISCCIFTFLVSCAIAQNPGDIDLSFNSVGYVVKNFYNNNDFCYAIKLQPDGKIVAAGSLEHLGDINVAVTRYKSDGIIDPSFGTNGLVEIDINMLGQEAYDLCILPNGKIVLACGTWIGSILGFATIRIDSTGSIDNTYGTNGITVTDFDTISAIPISLCFQPDGKSIIAGYTYDWTNGDFALARYDTTGNLDPTFGIGGKVVTSVNPGFDNQANSVVLQSNGKILAGGYASNGTICRFAIVRYLNNGAYDPTYGNGGFSISPFGGSYMGIADMLILPDNSVIACGQLLSGSQNDIALVKYDTTGVIDSTFGNNGKVITSIGTAHSRAYAITKQSDGKIIIAGISELSPSGNMVFARYDSTGMIDSSFGNNGIVLMNVWPNDDFARDIEIQADGKIVGAGYAYTLGTSYDFALVRLWGDILVSAPYTELADKTAIVYPNPTSGPLTLAVESDVALHNCRVELYNLQGRLLQEQEINETKTQFDLSQYATGIYFLRISNEDKTETVKMVKQ